MIGSKPNQYQPHAFHLESIDKRPEKKVQSCKNITYAAWAFETLRWSILSFDFDLSPSFNAQSFSWFQLFACRRRCSLSFLLAALTFFIARFICIVHNQFDVERVYTFPSLILPFFWFSSHLETFYVSFLVHFAISMRTVLNINYLDLWPICSFSSNMCVWASVLFDRIKLGTKRIFGFDLKASNHFHCYVLNMLEQYTRFNYWTLDGMLMWWCSEHERKERK